MKRIPFLLIYALFSLNAFAQTNTGIIAGKVVDEATKEPLIGVNVLIVDTPFGAATDENGTYAIPNLPVGTYRLSFQYIGYQMVIETDIVVRTERTSVVDADLKFTILETDGVLVTAEYYQKNQTELTSVVGFSTEEIRRSPGAGQEITRVLNALPGVASRGETSQDLFVRGGSPLENGFYIDNIFIPNASHFTTGDGSTFGPTGLINTEFVDNVDFYSGGFSSAYGDRLSSISMIRYRDGNSNRVTGELGLNFAGGIAIVEGPWAKGKGSFFVSGRRSYLDLIANAINAGGAPSFGDIQGKMTYRFNNKHSLSLLNLFGQSEFDQQAEDAEEDGDNEFLKMVGAQNTVGLTWLGIWNGNGYSSTSASYSFRTRDFTSQRLVDNSFKIDEELRTDYFNVRNVNFFQLNPRFKAEFGSELAYEEGTFEIIQDAYTSRAGIEQEGFIRDLDENNLRVGSFASFIARPLPRLQLTLGVRGDYTSLNEDFTVSPRAALSYQLTSKLAINGSAGVFHQAVPLYITAQHPANAALDQMQARHFIVGVDYMLTPDTKLTIEAYEKQYRNMPIQDINNSLGDPSYALDNRGELLGSLASNGESYARGVEVLLQKKLAEQVYGLASASYFRARYTDAQGVDRNRLFDNKVLFNVIGGYKPNDIWEFSVRWTYSGGRPVTPLDEAASEQFGDEVWDISSFNAERLPAYHALFVRADRRFNFKSSNMVTFLSLWNAYSRSNVEDYYWNINENRTDERNQFSLLPIIGIEFEF
ncbi:MAG: TonB-dependent receptor [Rhodothermaceae bacterium]|nr:TonB-dependent receptor [Rhodothermaceae bacterium]